MWETDRGQKKQLRQGLCFRRLCVCTYLYIVINVVCACVPSCSDARRCFSTAVRVDSSSDLIACPCLTWMHLSLFFAKWYIYYNYLKLVDKTSKTPNPKSTYLLIMELSASSHNLYQGDIKLYTLRLSIVMSRDVISQPLRIFLTICIRHCLLSALLEEWRGEKKLRVLNEAQCGNIFSSKATKPNVIKNIKSKQPAISEDGSQPKITLLLLEGESVMHQPGGEAADKPALARKSNCCTAPTNRS